MKLLQLMFTSKAIATELNIRPTMVNYIIKRLRLVPIETVTQRGYITFFFSGEQRLQIINRYTNPPPKKILRGINHPGWKVQPSVKSGRRRACNLYALGPCAKCERPGTDRHHKDSNTLNNVRSNVEILCRRCHMEEDGRLEKLLEIVKRPRSISPPTPCITCKRLYKPLRKGECSRCADRRRYPSRQLERQRRRAT